jgi:hypothetical protein
MNPFGSKLARSTAWLSLLVAIVFVLPVKIDAQHSISYSPALAGERRDTATAYNNNTDNYGHEQNQDEQYIGR